MLSKKTKMLFDLLLSGEYQTARHLGEILGISEKTVRNRISELSGELKEYGAEIISKPRNGYKLKVNDFQKYEKLEEMLRTDEIDINSETIKVPQTNQERIYCILAYLINRREYVKSEDLAEFMFVSKSTFSVCMKSVNSILDQYDLELIRRPGYGMKISGDECSIRRFICDYFIKNDSFSEFGFYHQQKAFQAMTKKVWELLERYQIHLAEIEFEVFVTYTYVACKRIKFGFYLEDDKKISCQSRKNEDSFIEEMSSYLEEKWEIEFTETEKNYFLLYLKGRQYFPNDFNFTIHEALDRIVVSLIIAIKKEYIMDFSGNLDFRMALNQHLVPFDIRMRYDIVINNPMLDEIKKNYSLAYEMVNRTFYVVRDYYKKDIPENELGFFALIYELALEKEKMQKENNVLVVCSSGKGTSQLLKYRLKEKFSEYIDQIFVCDLIGLESFDFSRVDYIFTTVPIRKKVPVPILEIGTFIRDEDIKVINKMLRYGHTDVLKNYYRKERFYPEFPGKSKEEVIHLLCQLIMDNENVDSDFERLVFEREDLAQMNLGTSVAMPHPARQASDDTLVYVAVLQKPIKWNDFYAQIVLLMSIGRQEDKNREFFYEATSKFVLNEHAVNAVIEHPVYEELIKQMTEAWEE